jgi:hypothetical protein
VAYSVREVLGIRLFAAAKTTKTLWNEGVAAARQIQLLILLTDSKARALTDSVFRPGGLLQDYLR